MMKLFKSLFVPVLLLWVGVVQAAEVRIWPEIHDKGFQAFYDALETNGMAETELGISTEGLAVVAFGNAKEKGLVAASDKEAFIKLFRQRNGLTGAYISPESFRSIGAGKGFFIGSLADMQQALSNLAPVAKVTAADTALQQLQAEVAALKKNGESKQDIAALKSKVEALNATLKAQGESNVSFRAKAEKLIKDSNQKIAAFENRIGKVIDQKVEAKVDASVQALKVTDAALDERLDQLMAKFKSLFKQGEKVDELAAVVDRTAYAAFAGFVLLAAALAALAFRQVKTGKLVKRHENALSGVGTTRGLVSEVKGLEARIDHSVQAQQQIIDRVTVVEEKAGGRVQYDEVTLATIVEQVKQLNESGAGSFESALTVDGKIYKLRFAFAESGYVMVEGVRDQTRPVQIGKVRSVLLRAAGAGRIVGVGKVFSLEDDDTVVIPLAAVASIAAPAEEIPQVLRHRRLATA
jgi:hypothetical protein